MFHEASWKCDFSIGELEYIEIDEKVQWSRWQN
jgi:hypothetical protein